mmetsp:Transcript_36004/g.73304  ORF Transcript_36004/g.73304 Transcript_36004/m.73304 type:complete len:81 (-) Transcript_36004:871-1113(-)
MRTRYKPRSMGDNVFHREERRKRLLSENNKIKKILRSIEQRSSRTALNKRNREILRDCIGHVKCMTSRKGSKKSLVSVIL